MRTLWPNLDQEEGLETVLEVPIPEEMFGSTTRNPWQTIKSWLMIRPHAPRPTSSDLARRAIEIQLLLRLIGAPLISSPHQNTAHHHNIKPHPIERSMASYIVQQYIAASGGHHALNSIESMCAVGKVKMAAASQTVGGEMELVTKMKSMKQGKGELGGFVLWQKRPHLWSLELMLSGFKISAGCDGKVAWSCHHSHGASRAPPSPLRRSLQGLDPRSTADLFSDSICTGEKTINGEDCFVLKLETEETKQRERSRVEITKHIILGCFSQKSGLLVQLEDSHTLRIKSSSKNEVVWETKMESLIQDYRTIDGVNIAHGGRTTVWCCRFGDDDTRTRMEEIWSIEEVDFNIKGLSTDCFLPPADLKKDDDQECGGIADCDTDSYGQLRHKALDSCTRICGSRSGRKVVAIDEDDLEVCGEQL